MLESLKSAGRYPPEQDSKLKKIKISDKIQTINSLQWALGLTIFTGSSTKCFSEGAEIFRVRIITWVGTITERGPLLTVAWIFICALEVRFVWHCYKT